MRSLVFNNENIEIDSGINFGFGVFETILVKNNPKFLDYHIGRLKKGIEVLGLKPLKEEVILRNKLEELDCKNNAVKILVTEKNIIISIRTNSYRENDYKIGFSLKKSEVIKNSTSRLTFIKSINYAENIIEKKLAKKEGYDDVIYINEKGFITETTVANIFGIKNNKLYTSKISDGILDGTVREFIIKNYEVIEKSITLEELKDMDEVFITNSLMGIMYVKSIEDKYFTNMKIDKIREFYENNLIKNGVELIYDR